MDEYWQEWYKYWVWKWAIGVPSTVAWWASLGEYGMPPTEYMRTAYGFLERGRAILEREYLDPRRASR